MPQSWSASPAAAFVVAALGTGISCPPRMPLSAEFAGHPAARTGVTRRPVEIIASFPRPGMAHRLPLAQRGD
jgi:hypothetical protein